MLKAKKLTLKSKEPIRTKHAINLLIKIKTFTCWSSKQIKITFLRKENQRFVMYYQPTKIWTVIKICSYHSFK